MKNSIICVQGGTVKVEHFILIFMQCLLCTVCHEWKTLWILLFGNPSYCDHQAQSHTWI